MEKLNEAERHELHYTVQNRRIEQEQAALFAKHSVPLAYDHKKAKLDLLERWPAELRRIRTDLGSGAYRQCEHADVEDIGFRESVEGQAEDVKRGQEAIDEIRRLGMMPKEMGRRARFHLCRWSGAGRRLTFRLTGPSEGDVARQRRDQRLRVARSFLFIHRGLLEAAENKSQLVGVIAHEIAHITARHGHRLMKQAAIACILYQAAQVGAVKSS